MYDLLSIRQACVFVFFFRVFHLKETGSYVVTRDTGYLLVDARSCAAKRTGIAHSTQGVWGLAGLLTPSTCTVDLHMPPHPRPIPFLDDVRLSVYAPYATRIAEQ